VRLDTFLRNGQRQMRRSTQEAACYDHAEPFRGSDWFGSCYRC